MLITSGTPHPDRDFDRLLQWTVEKVRRAIGVDRSTLLEMLGMSAAQFERIQAGKAKFSIQNLDSLSKAIDLNIDLLFTGAIDYMALNKQFRGSRPGKQALPDQYLVPEHQIAHVRAVNSMLTFLAMFRDERQASALLSRLQVRPEDLSNPEDLISPALGMKILSEARLAGLSDNEIRGMGSMTQLVARQTRFGQALMSRGLSPHAMYQLIFDEHQDAFDQVWSYRLLHVDEKGCTISMSQRPETSEMFHSHVVGCRETCLFLQGVFGSLQVYANQNIAQLTESECMYLGGERCVYHLTWGHPIAKRHLSAVV